MNKRSEIAKEILHNDMSRIRKKIKENSDISFLQEFNYNRRKQMSLDNSESYIFKDAASNIVRKGINSA